MGAHDRPRVDYSTTVLTFGKHRGKSIGSLDLSYLGYLYEQCQMPPHLVTAVEREIARRIGRDPEYRNPFDVLAEFSQRGLTDYE